MTAQLLINTLASASAYALMGVSFATIFFTVRFFHFAHGAVFAIGAYLLVQFSGLGVPVPLAFLPAVLGAAAVGWLMWVGVYRPLRNRAASPLQPLLASLGLYVVLENLVAIVWGDAARFIATDSWNRVWRISGGSLTLVQMVQLAVSAMAILAVAVFLKRTRFGLGLRAVAVDYELAGVSGVRAGRTVTGAFLLGSAMAGLAGGLVALDTGATPTMGMRALMMGLVVMVVGGGRNILGIALGALLLAASQNAGALVVGGMWQEAIALGVLFVFLLVRPHGFLGRRTALETT